MEKPTNGLRRRMAPWVPCRLAVNGDPAAVQVFKLSFDFNAFVRVEDTTGYGVLNGEIWRHLDRSATLGAMFWAALIAQQPEFDAPDGLAAAQSYMDAGNADAIAEALLDAFIVGLPEDKQAAMIELKKKALHGAENPTPPAELRAAAPLPAEQNVR